jgi:transcription antitermination factor NusG
MDQRDANIIREKLIQQIIIPEEVIYHRKKIKSKRNKERKKMMSLYLS